MYVFYVQTLTDIQYYVLNMRKFFRFRITGINP